MQDELRSAIDALERVIVLLVALRGRLASLLDADEDDAQANPGE